MNQIINRSWIIIDDVRFAVDSITAFRNDSDGGTLVYLSGGQMIGVSVAPSEFQTTLERAV